MQLIRILSRVIYLDMTLQLTGSRGTAAVRYSSFQVLVMYNHDNDNAGGIIAVIILNTL